MNFWIPERNNITPSMDMYGLQKQVVKCTEANSPKSRNLKACHTCPYYKTSDCWQRLMLDAAHAITLLLAERDKGEALIVEGDGNEV